MFIRYSMGWLIGRYKYVGTKWWCMCEYIFEVERKYEKRRSSRAFADSLPLAKEEARKIVRITDDMEWVEDGPHTWKLEGYGEHGETCTITKHILTTSDDE